MGIGIQAKGLWRGRCWREPPCSGCVAVSVVRLGGGDLSQDSWVPFQDPGAVGWVRTPAACSKSGLSLNLSLQWENLLVRGWGVQIEFAGGNPGFRGATGVGGHQGSHSSW